MASSYEPPRYFAGDVIDESFNTFAAIDFGTTFSGFAFALGRVSRIFHDPEKVPTAMILDKNTRLVSFGREALLEFGDLEDTTENYYFDRFKMELHNEPNVHRRMPITDFFGKSLEAQVVFGRALEYFHHRVKTSIADRSGTSVRELDIKWIITVPAIWGDRAKELMKAAAQEAGIPLGNLEIALEPEAATFASREDLQHVYEESGRPKLLRTIMADCGGGTVDVKVQDISIRTGRAYDVDIASGGAWGGTCVDKNIRQLVTEAIGEEITDCISRRSWLLFEREVIEEVKKTVGSTFQGRVLLRFPPDMCIAIEQAGGDLQDLPTRVPEIQYRRKQRGLSFGKEVIEKCFEESIRNITDHLVSIYQRIDGIHCVLMVGGFSDSPLLLRHVESIFNNLGCRVIHPRDSSLAVVRGAVIHGQDPHIVQSRISLKTYGVKSHTAFRDGTHPPERLEIVDERRLCCDVFNAFVTKGESVTAENPTREQLFRPVKADQLVMEAVLYDSPESIVTFVDDPGCRELGRILVPSPHFERGHDRILQVSINFSDTSLKFKAVDITSGNSPTPITVRFECA